MVICHISPVQGLLIGWGPGHIWLHSTIEGPWPHYMILEVVLGLPLDTFFWALTTSWSRLLACVGSGPNLHQTLNQAFAIIASKHATNEHIDKALFTHVGSVVHESKKTRHSSELSSSNIRHALKSCLLVVEFNAKNMLSRSDSLVLVWIDDQLYMHPIPNVHPSNKAFIYHSSLGPMLIGYENFSFILLYFEICLFPTHLFLVRLHSSQSPHVI